MRRAHTNTGDGLGRGGGRLWTNCPAFLAATKIRMCSLLDDQKCAPPKFRVRGKHPHSHCGSLPFLAHVHARASVPLTLRHRVRLLWQCPMQRRRCLGEGNQSPGSRTAKKRGCASPFTQNLVPLTLQLFFL